MVPGQGTNVITVYLGQRAKWSLTGDKYLLCFMAFSVMVTIAGVTKIATGYPKRQRARRQPPLGRSSAGHTGSHSQIPPTVPPSSTDSPEPWQREKNEGTYPCPTTQLPDVPSGHERHFRSENFPNYVLPGYPPQLLAALSTLPFGV